MGDEHMMQVYGPHLPEPFVLEIDAEKSSTSMVEELLVQAKEREERDGRKMAVQVMLRHLVGAKLELVAGADSIIRKKNPMPDALAIPADFIIGDVAIHVSPAPSAFTFGQCKVNADQGYKPILVTLGDVLQAVEWLAKQHGILPQVDILGAEQFIAVNTYYLGHYSSAGRQDAMRHILRRYNELVVLYENDPSMVIEIEG